MRGNSEASATAMVHMLMTILVATAILSSFGWSADRGTSKGAVILGEPMCLLHGWVNDSVTHGGLSGATVGFIAPSFWIDTTETNETGYYEIMANRTEVIVVCQKFGFYPFVELVDLTGESAYRLDVELEAEPTVPMLSATFEPTANISAYNQMEVTFAAEDINPVVVEVVLGQVINKTGENLNFTMASVGVVAYNDYEGDWFQVGDLTFYDLTGDENAFEGKTEWGASSSNGGYLSNGTSSDYLYAQYERLISGHPSYGLAGLYFNASLSGEEGFAFFDGVSSEYLGFEFYNLSTLSPYPISDASPDDPEGEFAPILPVIPWNLSQSADLNEMAWTPGVLATQERRSVVDLTYDLDSTVPSGEYIALCLAFDEVYNVNGTVTLFTVDTECPVADAGDDIEVTLGEEALLEGSATDNVGIVSYVWTFDDGGEEVTLEGDSAKHLFVDPGDHLVTLAVTDGGGNRDYDSLMVSVNPGEYPVAEAGPAEQTVPEDVPVQFDGTDSYDEDGEVVEYFWEIIELDLTFDEAEFTYTFAEPGQYEVVLVVEDNLGLESDPDAMMVTVTDETDPIADAGVDMDVLVGEGVVLNGTGSSDNVGVTEYLWSCDELTDWNESDPEVALLIDIEGTYTFILETRDAAGNSDTDEVVVTVTDPNDAPVADAGDDLAINTGETASFNASGSSDDGEIVNYTWTFEYDGEPVVVYGETQEFIFNIEGEYKVNLTVTDDGGKKGYDEVSVTVTKGKSSTNFVPYAAVAVVVVAAVVLAVLLMKRKKLTDM